MLQNGRCRPNLAEVAPESAAFARTRTNGVARSWSNSSRNRPGSPEAGRCRSEIVGCRPGMTELAPKIGQDRPTLDKSQNPPHQVWRLANTTTKKHTRIDAARGHYWRRRLPGERRSVSRRRALSRPNACEEDCGPTHKFGHATRRNRSLLGCRRSRSMAASCHYACSGNRCCTQHGPVPPTCGLAGGRSDVDYGGRDERRHYVCLGGGGRSKLSLYRTRKLFFPLAM